MIVFTSITANYIPKAATLAESVKKHHPGTKFVLGLLEKEVPAELSSYSVFDEVVTPANLPIEERQSFLFRYSLVEGSTAVKGHLFQHLFDKFPRENNFIFLDPDTLVLSPLEELLQKMEEKEIVLTPHLTDPEEALDAIWDNEVCALQHGAFNLGFLALRRGPESQKFLNWWRHRLHHLCYADHSVGLFTDQKWVNLAPGFFDLAILRHPGYNVAPWNLSRRKISIDSNGNWLANGQPLRFFHFSGFDSGANTHMLNKYCPNPSDPALALRDTYIKSCQKQGQDKVGKTPWSYATFENGEVIQKNHRVVYSKRPELWKTFPNPFLTSEKNNYLDWYGTQKFVETTLPPFSVFVRQGTDALQTYLQRTPRISGPLKKLLLKTIHFSSKASLSLLSKTP